LNADIVVIPLDTSLLRYRQLLIAQWVRVDLPEVAEAHVKVFWRQQDGKNSKNADPKGRAENNAQKQREWGKDLHFILPGDGMLVVLVECSFPETKPCGQVRDWPSVQKRERILSCTNGDIIKK